MPATAAAAAATITTPTRDVNSVAPTNIKRVSPRRIPRHIFGIERREDLLGDTPNVYPPHRKFLGVPRDICVRLFQTLDDTPNIYRAMPYVNQG